MNITSLQNVMIDEPFVTGNDENDGTYLFLNLHLHMGAKL